MLIGLPAGKCQEGTAFALTGEGVIGVEEVDLLPPVPINVACCHTNRIALAIPQCIIWGATFIHCKVHQPAPYLVILQHQVGTIVPEGMESRKCDVGGASR